MQTIRFLSPISVLVLALGCASSSPSPELVDARRAYERARASQAAVYGPDRLLEAKQALDRAEAAHEDDAKSFEERRLAYIAERRAGIALAYGNYVEARHEEEAARRAYVEKQEELRQQAEARAAARGRELEATRERLGTVQSEAHATRQKLDQERRARTRAEEHATAAVASLKELANVKEDARGTVITLSGAVLFTTGKAELLPVARRKLEGVAAALVDLQPNERIVIEGHTDSLGDEAANQELSEQRASAVRDYLVEKGVAEDRIQTLGRGETSPLATNDTPEGRANNRRVEIIIQNGQKGQNGQMRQDGQRGQNGQMRQDGR